MDNNLASRLSESMAAFSRAHLNRRSDLPIRSSEMGALIYITINCGTDGVRVVELSEYFKIRKASVSSTIRSLEKAGYIERRSSPTDKRSSPLFPTTKGTDLVQKAFAEHHRIANQLIKSVGKARCEDFIEILGTVTKIIQDGADGK